MQKIYIVTESWATDYESGVNSTAFSTLELAKKYMKEASEEYKNFENYNYDTIDEEEEFIDIYKDGSFFENHTSFKIEELIVDEYVKGE